MDYAQELKKYQETLSDSEKAELQKLAGMQTDIAKGDSAEDFIRHPFFAAFERHMNEMIADAGLQIAAAAKKPGATMEDIKAIDAGIEKLKDLKRWLNKYVIAGRVARQAISTYEESTTDMNQKIQAAVDESKQ